MILFPAIDLYAGQAVRLLHGDYKKMTVYEKDPLTVAKKFAAAGVSAMHVVDLEGARDGGTPNFDVVCRLKKESGLFCEIGGGVRDMQTAERYLAAGLDRVILGTAAVEDPAFLAAAVEKFGKKIAVGVDIRDGKVAVRGWQKTADLDAFDFLKHLRDVGVATVICTDIGKDGAMRGANLPLYRRLQKEIGLDVVASGGVSSLEQIKALSDMGLYGAIIGRAWYEGAIDLKAAREAIR